MATAEEDENIFSNSVKFFENWYTLTELQKPELRFCFIKGIMDYGLYNKPAPKPADDNDLEAKACYAGYLTAKPSIDISKQRSIYGAIGGKRTASKAQAKPQAEAQAKPQAEPSAKPQAKPKAKAQAVKSIEYEYGVRVRDKQQKAAANARASRAWQPPPFDEFLKTVVPAGMPEESAARIFQELTASDWRDSNGARIGNWCKYAMAIYEEHKAKAPVATASSGMYYDELGMPVNPNDNL